MKVLAIDTGGAQWGAACVLTDEQRDEAQLLSVQVSSEPRKLSTDLLPLLGEVLQAAQWGFQDIELLAAGIGPGSWTGLRIGLSAAKTLAQTREWPLAGIPSFDAPAQAIWRSLDLSGESLILVATPCRPGEVNAKIYLAGEDYLAVLHTEWIGSLELTANTLRTEVLARSIENPLLLAGSAAGSIAEILKNQGETDCRVIEPPFENCLLELALSAAVKVDGGQSDDALTLEPLYLAPSNAERNLLAR